MVFTPANIVLLTHLSSLFFHPTDLNLKGVGYSTLAQKYRLGTLVRRKWCATSSTPKVRSESV
jgi:hypothetical protein